MSGPSTVTQENKPWGPQEEAYKRLFAEGMNAYESMNKNPYSGDLFAGPTSDQWAGVNSLREAAPGFAGGAADMRKLGVDQLQGKYLDPSSNPWVKTVVDNAMSSASDAFTSNVLPRLDDAAISGGAYGGARQDIQQNQATQDFSSEAQKNAAQIYYDNYIRERAIQQNSGGLLSGANALERQPGETLLDIGGLQQGWEQGELGADYTNWQQEQMAPWQGLDMLASVLGSGGFSTSVQTKSSNPITELLQGLIGGANIFRSLANPFAAAGGGVMTPTYSSFR